MNWKSFLYYIPYIFLILANAIYIYANGLKPIGTYPELFLYNLLFFALIGAVIIIKLNLLLHSWFVKEEGDVKQKTKITIKKVRQYASFLLSIFTKGNQRMMIKIFFFLNLSIWINKVIPGVLMGVLVGTYFQYKGYIAEKFKNQIHEVNQTVAKIINEIIQMLPKYKNGKLKAQ